MNALKTILKKIFDIIGVILIVLLSPLLFVIFFIKDNIIPLL